MERKAEHPVEPMFLARWSGRAMSGAAVDERDLRRLFEAARWAPSAANLQPWRFAYARAKSQGFDALFALLDEGNRVWCQRAGALIVVYSHTKSPRGTTVPSHSLDTGAAWMSLALQGSAMGLVVHGMGGFDKARARTVLGLAEGDDTHHVEMMIAVGHPGRVEELSEKDRAREQPNGRNAVETFVRDLSERA